MIITHSHGNSAGEIDQVVAAYLVLIGKSQICFCVFSSSQRRGIHLLAPTDVLADLLTRDP